MGVYIKGVNIPKRRAIDLCIHPDGTLVVFPENGLAYDTKGCVEEVPKPHGRLIDADALVNTVVFHTNISADIKEFIEDLIGIAPTVIGAEKG